MTWLDIIGYTYGIIWPFDWIMDEHLGLILTFNGKSVVGNMMIKPVDGIVCLPNTRNIFRQNDAVWNHRWNCAQQVFVRTMRTGGLETKAGGRYPSFHPTWWVGNPRTMAGGLKGKVIYTGIFHVENYQSEHFFLIQLMAVFLRFPKMRWDWIISRWMDRQMG